MQEKSILDKLVGMSNEFGEDMITSPVVYLTIIVCIVLWFIYKLIAPLLFSGHKNNPLKAKGHKVNFNCPVCSTNLRPTFERNVASRGIKPDIANVICPSCGTASRWDVVQESHPVLESFKKR